MYVRTYIHTYIRTYVRTYIDRYVHTYIHTLHIHMVVGWPPLAKPYELPRQQDLIKDNQKTKKISTRK